MNEKLNEIYDRCSRITITMSPHNPNTRQHVVIDADLSAVTHSTHGRFQYSKINVMKPTLDEAIDALHYLVLGHVQLVEAMP